MTFKAYKKSALKHSEHVKAMSEGQKEKTVHPL